MPKPKRVILDSFPPCSIPREELRRTFAELRARDERLARARRSRKVAGHGRVAKGRPPASHA